MNKENILELTDQNGNKINYEVLDLLEYDSKIYLVIIEEDPSITEVTIVRVENADDPEKSVYIPEDNEEILNKVYNSFKRKYNIK